MKTSIAGKNIRIGSSMSEYVTNKIRQSSNKLLKDVSNFKVVFSKQFNDYFADIIIHDTHLGTVKSNSHSHEIYTAFDMAISKIEKRLGKFRDKISSKEKRNPKKLAFSDIPDLMSPVKPIVNNKPKEQIQANMDKVIIAESAKNIEDLTIAEAAIKMDLSHMPALLFNNKASKRLNLVFQRHDGNIAWVDPG